MKRTISAMVGKGSVNHNSRKFAAQNVDSERTNQNIDYCNENIKKVYHELFDEALARYNEKQTRSDRRITNYYEKIRSSKQEKPFHELILQIGDKDNMGAMTEDGQLARTVLDEYYRDFQARNPNLRVFSAHLHMDEATPHLHIDFVPVTTGSKRGLETRVSLKQALAAQGFKGGTRSETEWNQWVLSEKKQLAAVMERHGIEWEQKGTHEKHLSVMEFEKGMRVQELAELDQAVEKKQVEVDRLQASLGIYKKETESIQKINQKLQDDPDYNLPEPPALMTAKNYRAKFADGVVKKLKDMLRSLVSRLYDLQVEYAKVCSTNDSLRGYNSRLVEENRELTGEINRLQNKNKDFALLKKAFGKDQIGSMVTQARELELQRKNARRQRVRNREWER